MRAIAALRAFVSRVYGLRHRSAAEREMVEELEFHLAMLIDEGIARGLSRDEARRKALLALGGSLAIGETVHEQAGVPLLETAWQDIRYAVRSLRTSIAFSSVAILTMAIGIGANAAMFTIVNAVLLRPLPFRDPGQLIAISEYPSDEAPSVGQSVSYPDFRDIGRRSGRLLALAAFEHQDLTLTKDRESVPVSAETMTASLLTVLGVQPVLGRAFLEEEDTAGHDAMILSARFWRAHFSGDPSVLGTAVRLNGVPTSIVGIMPEGFQFPVRASDTDLWVSFSREDAAQQGTPEPIERNNHHLEVVARLKPDAHLAEANAELSAVARSLAEAYPDTNRHTAITATSELAYIVGDRRTPLLMLFAAVGFVVLIACANVANLLLARSTDRAREIALRLALGAGQRRIVRQLLTESLVLSLVGAVAGLIVARGALGAFQRFFPVNLPRAEHLVLDWPVLIFTAGLAMLTTVLAGLAPALTATGTRLRMVMQDGRGSSTHNRLRSAFVISEAALGVILLVGAALLLRSFDRLSRTDLGFDPTHLVTAHFNVSETRYAPDAKSRFIAELLDRVSALPNVTAAAGALPLPMFDDRYATNVDISERPLPKEQQPIAGFSVVTPGFFETMRIPLITGRTFDRRDRRDSAKVTVITKSFAERYFANENPIGKRMTVVLSEGPRHGDYHEWEIVGVVGDTRRSNLQSAPAPAFYLPLPQMMVGTPSLVVRVADERVGMAAEIRDTLRRMDSEAVSYGIRSMDDYVALALGQSRFQTVLLSLFATIALLLTAIGLYGVMAYTVGQRLRELGIRRALGATSGQVMMLVMRNGLALTVFGVSTGLAGALILAHVGRSLLYEVSSDDPISYIVAAGVLIIVGVMASYVPSARASRVDPMTVLRCE
jgi:putative ABC transport system permease protein